MMSERCWKTCARPGSENVFVMKYKDAVEARLLEGMIADLANELATLGADPNPPTLCCANPVVVLC